MERTVRGRPVRLGLDRAACRFLIRSRRQQNPVRGPEAHHLPAQLALQHRDLMAQDQDLGVLVPIACEKETQDRERVHHRQIGQSQQHSRTSCRDDRLSVAIPAPYMAMKPRT
jgi:hypothetical protein